MQTYFIIKHNYHEENFKKATVVKFITIINNCCLIENIYNKKRLWIMKYDIYPIFDHDIYGCWTFDENYQKLIPENINQIINELL